MDATTFNYMQEICTKMRKIPDRILLVTGFLYVNHGKNRTCQLKFIVQ